MFDFENMSSRMLLWGFFGKFKLAFLKDLNSDKNEEISIGVKRNSYKIWISVLFIVYFCIERRAVLIKLAKTMQVSV